MAEYLGSLKVGLPALALSAALTVPVNGVLVRFRANYTPQRVQLDEEGASSGNEYWKCTYFTMAKRVYDIEGVAGFWKGFWPSFLTLATIFGGVQGLIAVAPHLGGRIHWSPAFGVLGSIGALMVALIVGVPIKVIFCRAVVTPHKLYPLAFLSPIAYYIFALSISILLTPLDVVAIRLAVQGSHATFSDDTPEDVGETVVRLRDEQVKNSYGGLVDCLKKIRDEEGLAVLYRGWWMVSLSALYILF
ncbi:mitochondrial carrier domain-containing protein [Mucidula mucida]|nr:mitochondrial carrier domain-containing protein [Mucidula mucida]